MDQCSLHFFRVRAQMLARVLFLSVLVRSTLVVTAGNFTKDVDIMWGDGRGQILKKGRLLTLTLDQVSGSGFQSRNEFLYCKIDMQIKLIPGNSAGTVVAYYLRSQGTSWDEIDFEFLGNLSGDPYVLHTNIYTQGRGNREKQYYLWFDPTVDFHTYSVLWNPLHIVIYVDKMPIREFKNLEGASVPYPKSQPMRVYSSIWNADEWATRGGLIKTNWTLAPFTASYKNFNDRKACIWLEGASSCSSSNSTSAPWLTQRLEGAGQRKMKDIQSKYMIYDYCKDSNRFPRGLPLECTIKTKS